MPVDPTLFANPPARHRGAPFFALNHDLTNHDRLREHLAAFEAMGLGGAHLHVRPGLRTPYLGEAFLDAIRANREFAVSRGLLTYLYDEDTWPSGFAGGAVTRDSKFRRRWAELRRGGPGSEETGLDPQTLAAYRLSFGPNQVLEAVEVIDPAQADDACWFLTRWVAPNSDRYNGAAYLDVLNPEAVAAFIESTYVVYREAFGGKFPGDVPSIFTDEPQLGLAKVSSADRAQSMVWTDDLADSFATAYNTPLLPLLPYLFWPGPDGPHPVRWQYWNHIAERFTEAFSNQIGNWCQSNGIALTGHLMLEDSLAAQTVGVGECMRHYPAYGIPGIDVLCDQYLPATAKQAISVARQEGRQAVMSELYGVTNWDFPFAGHKRQGDWQAALGITLRVPHLTWLSMEGSSKRDYPASIGIQSPWYQEYPLIENHFARINVALAEGQPLVRIAVIHPIESAWLRTGLPAVDKPTLQRLEKGFQDLTNGLLEATLDFDFVAESLLPAQEKDTPLPVLQVGKMAYDAVVVPQLETIRTSTLDSLQLFHQRGGTVLVLGSLPERCDGDHSRRPREVLSPFRILPDLVSLVEALEPFREVSVTDLAGVPKPLLNHQLRLDGVERVLFVSNRQATTPWNPFHGQPDLSSYIRLRGQWLVREFDTFSGLETPCEFQQQNGWTLVPWLTQPTSHRLLRLTPGEGDHHQGTTEWLVLGDGPEPDRVTREEPNVLLLDQPEWRLEGEENWEPAEDSLMVQLRLAERFGWPDWSQPYTVTDRGQPVTVHRRFRFRSETDLIGTQLVCERASDATIRLDGQPVDSTPSGHWIDRDLPTVTLPPLKSREHTLEVTLPLNAVDRHLEWCYLLGEFNVETRGNHAWLVPAEQRVYWGDAVHQGLPFYGGNLDYELALNIEEETEYALQFPCFGGPLLRVWCNDRDCGPIAFPPFRCSLGQLTPGTHRIRVRAYGNRHNTFGALHNNRPDWTWFGPPAWRLQEAGRNAVWQFKPSGILRAPLLERRGPLNPDR